MTSPALSPVSPPAAGSTSGFSILTFLHSFDPGGVERVALRLTKTWAEAGHEVHVLMGRRTGAEERPAGVRFDFAPENRFAHRFESLWLVPHLVAGVRRHRPDVLFCAGNTYVVVAVLARLLLGRACPPIVCKVSNSLDRKDFGWAMRRLYPVWLRLQARFIDRFVGMAETMRPEMAAALGLPAHQLAIVHDGALSLDDIARAERAPRPDGTPRGRTFIAVGRLAAQKDFGLLVRAFARIASEDDRLIILGEGPERARLVRLATDLGVADRVVLPGHAQEVTRQLAAADVFVLSSRYEGVPAAVLEALAAGASIVATDCSVAMAELLENGRLGRLTPPGDVRALAEAMDSAGPVGPTTRAAMRAQAERFTVERAGAAYLALMQPLVRLRSTGPALHGRDLATAAVQPD
ncbi:MAG TPA: glycosyltransferase [Caulobacteraceae bacterium]|nr:glycosyltransferase [Caulobacteraceae bacterium]